MMKGVLRPTYESGNRRNANAWTGSVPVDIAENNTATCCGPTFQVSARKTSR